MWRWRRMEKISWTESVTNEEVLHRVKKERNIIHTVKRRKGIWIGRILCKNCFVKHTVERGIEEGIEVTGRQQRRCKQSLGDVKETTGHLRESTRWQCVENWLRERLWISCKTDIGMNE
jgi:hypothetical protein